LRTLSADDVVYIHARVISQSGGSDGLRDRGSLESSVSQPFQSFGGNELYPTLLDKAAALAFFLASNHPFVDGNKRVAHAALAVMLRLNGYRVYASVNEQEQIMLRLASGKLTRVEFSEWVNAHVLAAGA
jgi:death-on-curing protein